MSTLETEAGRRVVLVFTDGADMFSKNRGFDDVLNRAMQETALSSADQGLAVKAVQVATQRRAADQGGGAPAEPAASAEPAGEAW